MMIRWEYKEFKELSVTELYALMQLRAEVFIDEQNCPYQDADGKDLKSFHLMGYNENNDLVVYSRILPQNVSYPEVSIGRVVSSPKARGTGAGKHLMDSSLKAIKQ